MKRRTLLATATLIAAMGASFSAQAQTKWDLASAYPAFNFHTENLVEFSKDVAAGTNNELKSSVPRKAAKPRLASSSW